MLKIIAYVISLVILAIFNLFAVRGPKTGGSAQQVAVILSEVIPVEYVSKKLPSWDIRTDYPARADFVYGDGLFLQNSKINNIRAKLRCRLDARALFDKTILHERLMESSPDTICKSYRINESIDTAALFTEAPVWILKANWGWSGMGNRIVTNADEYVAAVDDLMEPRSDPDMPTSRGRPVEIIANEYIADPMLYLPPGAKSGHKFHLRLYVVVLVKSDGKKCVWIKNTGALIPAAVPYEAAKYDDAQIHDTHLSKNPTQVAVYPDALDTAGVVENVNDMVKRSFGAMLPYVDKYSESQNGYDLYGIDVMLTAAGDAKLLEINRFPGILSSYGAPALDSINWNNEVFDTVMSSAFEEVFGGYPVKNVVTRII